jgi:hypothetical protein
VGLGTGFGLIIGAEVERYYPAAPSFLAPDLVVVRSLPTTGLVVAVSRVTELEVLRSSRMQVVEYYDWPEERQCYFRWLDEHGTQSNPGQRHSDIAASSSSHPRE